MLAAAQRPLALFAQAIANQPVVIEPTLARSTWTPIFPGKFERPVLEEAQTALTALTVWLPGHDSVLPTQPDHRAALRIAVLRQVGVPPLLGTQDVADLRAQLDQTPCPVLARRLFRIAERIRVDAALPDLYPGATPGLHQTRQHELGARRHTMPGRPLAALIEALSRSALGCARPLLAGYGHCPDLARLTDLSAILQNRGATPQDSVRVALAQCGIFRRFATRPRRQWVIADVDGSGLPLALRGANLGDGGPGPQHQPAIDGQDSRQKDSEADDLATPAVGPSPQQGLPCHLHPGAGDGVVFAGGHEQGGANPESHRLRHGNPALGNAQIAPTPFSQSRPGHRQMGAVSHHDEWDYQAQAYRPAWCRVQEQRLVGDNLLYLQQVRQQHSALFAGVRRKFAALRPEARQRRGGLLDGDELDWDSAVQARVEWRAGHWGDGRIFSAQRELQRDVSAAFLVDLSGSTGYLVPSPPGAQPHNESFDLACDDSPYLYAPPSQALASGASTPPPRRVIDLAKESLCLMCEALHILGDRHAVYGFSGQGRHEVEFWVAKEFHEAWSARSAGAIGAMQPRRYTRTGAAIRHALRRMAHESARTRVLVVITDGYPQDTDYGPDPARFDYGIHDTARALQEAQGAGIDTFCITIDVAAHDYLRRICAPKRYLVLDDVAQLPEQLTKVYRSLTSGWRPAPAELAG